MSRKKIGLIAVGAILVAAAGVAGGTDQDVAADDGGGCESY